MNILLVEDNVPTGKTLSEIMRAWGHHIQWVTTGEEALAEVRRIHSDLILLDISLPDIQGYELIPAIKGIQPEVGIVTMTGHNSRDLEAKVRKEGIVYYMIKPFDLKILRDILEHISGRVALHENDMFPWRKSSKTGDFYRIQ